MEMHRRKLIVIMLAGAIIASLVFWYAFQLLTFSPESKAVEISKQSLFVQQFFDLYSPEDVRPIVRKFHIKYDGSYYEVNENWESGRYIENTSEPTDGKDHYCWVVYWHPTWVTGTTHYIRIFIDRDSWEIVSEKEVFLP